MTISDGLLASDRMLICDLSVTLRLISRPDDRSFVKHAAIFYSLAKEKRVGSGKRMPERGLAKLRQRHEDVGSIHGSIQIRHKAS